MTKKQLVILVLVCVLVLIFIYYFPVFLGPTVFGQNLVGSLNLMVLVSKMWWWILFGTLIVASVLSVVFKKQGKPLKKIWISAGLIIGITLLIAMLLTLLSTSALYQLPEANIQ